LFYADICVSFFVVIIWMTNERRDVCMGWIILIVIVALIAASLDTVGGKLVIGSIVLSLGALLLRWITGVILFTMIAKWCAITIVSVITLSLLIAIVT